MGWLEDSIIKQRSFIEGLLLDPLSHLAEICTANWNKREALDNLEPLTPTLKQKGADHVAYGIQKRDYNVVGASLLWTLEKGLGDKFTDEVRNAWGAVYEVLSTVMKEGAVEADKAAWFFNMVTP